MADEIPNQNVIKTYRVKPRDGPGFWASRIGPRGRALWGFGPTPAAAIANLTARLPNEWTFDETWTPRDAE